jgi:hypothetical protein
MTTILFSFLFFAIIFGLLSIRILLVKNGEFRGTCSTSGESMKAMGLEECSVCGKKADEMCKN